MIYRLKNGDLLKILPIIKKDGSIKGCQQVTSLYIDQGGKFKVVHDTKGYLSKMWWGWKKSENYNKSCNFSNKHYICALVNNKVEFILIGNKLYGKIVEFENRDLTGDKHLLISFKMVDCGGMMLPNYDDSKIISMPHYNPPIENSDSVPDWIEWIKKNQPFYLSDYLEPFSVFNNLSKVEEIFGQGSVAEVISKERSKRIKEILSEV